MSNEAATSKSDTMTDADDPPVFEAISVLLDEIERALAEIRQLANQMKDKAPR